MSGEVYHDFFGCVPDNDIGEVIKGTIVSVVKFDE